MEGGQEGLLQDPFVNLIHGSPLQKNLVVCVCVWRVLAALLAGMCSLSLSLSLSLSFFPRLVWKKWWAQDQRDCFSPDPALSAQSTLTDSWPGIANWHTGKSDGERASESVPEQAIDQSGKLELCPADYQVNLMKTCPSHISPHDQKTLHFA